MGPRCSLKYGEFALSSVVFSQNTMSDTCSRSASLGLGHLQAGSAHDERGHTTQCRERQQPSRLTNRWLWIRRGEGGEEDGSVTAKRLQHSGLSKQPTLTPSQWRPRRCQVASIEQAAESLRAMRAKAPQAGRPEKTSNYGFKVLGFGPRQSAERSDLIKDLTNLFVRQLHSP